MRRFAVCLGGVLFAAACTVQMTEPNDRACDDSNGCQAGQTCVDNVCRDVGAGGGNVGGGAAGGSAGGSVGGGEALGGGSVGGGTAGGAAGGGAVVMDGGVVIITPALVRLQLQQTAQFSAQVSGLTDQRVTWSMVETNSGSVTDGGLYSAPNLRGTFHVKATSVANTGRADASVVIVDDAPLVTTGLFARYSADQLNGAMPLPPDDAGVAQWNDISGGDHHVVQADPARQPHFIASSFGGKPWVLFDGANDLLNTAVFANALPQPTTVVIVFTGPNGVFNLIDSPLGAGQQRNRIQIAERGTNGEFGYSVQLMAGLFGSLPPPDQLVSIRRPHVVAAVFDGENSISHLDGVALGMSRTPGDGGIGGIQIGYKQDPNPVPGTKIDASQIAEVLVYNRRLSPAEISQVEFYLQARYGL